MRNVFSTLFISFMLAYSAASMSGDLPQIAFVNLTQVLEQAPQADAVREILDREFAVRETDLASGDKKLELLKQRLEREATSLTEDERRKLERELITQEREMKRSHEEYGEDRNIRKNEELAKMQREIRVSIVTLAKELDYDMVLESGVMYASERVDVTGQVIERLKQDFSSRRAVINQ